MVFFLKPRKRKLAQVSFLIENPPAGWRKLLARDTRTELPDSSEFNGTHKVVLDPEQVVDLIRVQFHYGWLIRIQSVVWVEIARKSCV